MTRRADDVTAYVNAKWPEANRSPLAMAFDAAQVNSESDDYFDDNICEAVEHAHSRIDTCKAQDIDYDEETIAHNVQSNFPDLDEDTCDHIAMIVVGDRR